MVCNYIHSYHITSIEVRFANRTPRPFHEDFELTAAVALAFTAASCENFLYSW